MAAEASVQLNVNVPMKVCQVRSILLCRRQSEVDAKARDVRLQRALEEVERFKALLQDQRAADRDHKDVNKSEYNRVFAGEGCVSLSAGSGCCTGYADCDH